MKKKAKARKPSSRKAKKEVLVPSKPSTEVVPDFTARAIANSNSKRIRFRRGVELLLSKVSKKKALEVEVRDLVGDLVATSLPRKVAKSLDLSSKGIELRIIKTEAVEGKKAPLVSAISLVRA